MTPVKTNFNSMFANINCDYCEMNVPESDLHLLECEKMIETCQSLRDDYETEYVDIVGPVESQIRVTKLYDAIFQAKKKLEESK